MEIDNEKKESPDGKPENRFKILERIPLFRSIISSREKLFERFGLKEEKDGQRLFFPYFSRDPSEKNKGPRDEEKNDSPFNKKEMKSKEENQERYWIGYRLNRITEKSRPSWVLGFGWKNGSQNGGQRGKKEEESKESKDSQKDLKKKEFSGPILGITGQF